VRRLPDNDGRRQLTLDALRTRVSWSMSGTESARVANVSDVSSSAAQHFHSLTLPRRLSRLRERPTRKSH